MRGYGDSDKPAGRNSYQLKALRADLKGLIEHLGYKKCVLVCHDWGAVVGWSFVSHHMDMIDRYVMMGAPSSVVWRKSVISSIDQFIKSWYVFMFQMPLLPEFTLSLNDYAKLKTIGGNKFNDTFTEEDLEAYKYTFSKPGGLTGPINYYRSNLGFWNVEKTPEVKKFAPGLYLLGENDTYISKDTLQVSKKLYKGLQFDVVAGANHFLQQDAPKATNQAIRKFLEN